MEWRTTFQCKAWEIINQISRKKHFAFYNFWSWIFARKWSMIIGRIQELRFKFIRVKKFEKNMRPGTKGKIGKNCNGLVPMDNLPARWSRYLRWLFNAFFSGWNSDKTICYTIHLSCSSFLPFQWHIWNIDGPVHWNGRKLEQLR